MVNRHIHLGDLLELLADAVPTRPALITSEVELSYAGLDERATRFANHLTANGVGAGDHVGIHATNCAEWVEAFYGCFKLRAVPINVNYRYVETELRYLYDNSDCAAVVVGADYVAALDAVADALPGLRHRLVIGPEYEAALAAASAERAFDERSPDDHYIVYTGGTTGMPKGVVWRQEDLVRGALNSFRFGRPIDSVEQLVEEAVAAPEGMRLMAMGPMMHGGSQWAMGNVHVVGGAFVLYTEPRFDAHKVLELAARSGTNSLATIGDAMARPIAEALAASDRPDYDLSKLAALSNGGAPLSAGVREQLHAVLPNLLIVDGYGSSETGAAGVKAEAAGEGGHSAPRFDVGPDTTVLGEDLRVCAMGEIGMLARSGAIPLGYYKDPEKTAATFPTVDGRRWVLPGDFARLEDDGTISILGRGSVSINSGGEKIFPEEVESALVKHPAVFDAAVVGTPNDRFGQQVTALVQFRQGASDVSLDDLRTHCRTLIADYKAPRAMVVVEAVPRTPVGKVDYKAAAAEALERLGAP